MADRFTHSLAVAWNDRGVLTDAPLTLLAASLAIRLVPFRRLVALAAWRGSEAVADPRAVSRTTGKARWAVERWGSLMPWRTKCFEKGLALHWMLRRRGIASRLHYGLDGQSAEGGLSGHVWVSVGDRIVIGGAEAASHACLLSVPDNCAAR